ncbi:MAG: sugar phosphate isomerase/epimerase, partial [Sphaerochaetaceae bacterium]|nr:sugar phosphate isomerase/epimerase [Sphaerochaetaceae bacterium]
MMQFGFRAHDFGRMPIERLARTLHVFAPVTIHLALTKALDTYPDAGQLSPGYARRIRKVLESHDIDIAVLGCYIN